MRAIRSENDPLPDSLLVRQPPRHRQGAVGTRLDVERPGERVPEVAPFEDVAIGDVERLVARARGGRGPVQRIRQQSGVNGFRDVGRSAGEGERSTDLPTEGGVDPDDRDRFMATPRTPPKMNCGRKIVYERPISSAPQTAGPAVPSRSCRDRRGAAIPSRGSASCRCDSRRPSSLEDRDMPDRRTPARRASSTLANISPFVSICSRSTHPAMRSAFSNRAAYTTWVIGAAPRTAAATASASRRSTPRCA